MKKALIGACLALMSGSLYAQEIMRSISIGIKAGANYATVLKDGTGASAIHGGNGGAALNYRYTKKHASLTEVVYSQKGFIQPDKNLKNSLSYLEIPVMYKRTFFCHKKGGNIVERKRSGNFFAIAGPQMSILLTSKVKTHESKSGAEGTDTNIDLYPYTRPFDISAVAGVGYTMKNGLTLDARYALGLRSLNGSYHGSMPKDVNNSTLQLNISYFMPVHL